MFDYDDYDERESRLATPAEAVAEFGRNAGMDNPDRAWLLHDWDVWVKNPYYVGPPVPHPETDPGDDGEFDPGVEFDAGPELILRPFPADDDIPF